MKEPPKTMEFKEFDKHVFQYGKLPNNRYVITFHGGTIEFYKLVGTKLIKEGLN